jgi:hypothetical protein
LDRIPNIANDETWLPPGTVPETALAEICAGAGTTFKPAFVFGKLDPGRGIPWGQRFAIGNDRTLAAGGLVDDEHLTELLESYTEIPARNLARRIISQGGKVMYTNAYDEGPWGIWWQFKGKEYFTPLLPVDYEGEPCSTITHTTPIPYTQEPHAVSF